MRVKSVFVALLLIVVSALATWAAPPPQVRYEIQFPDLPGFQTLACDFHQHTVFSDGDVWPTVRVAEAWRQGLHAIAITDHIEYQPHKADVPTNHCRPCEIAAPAARAANLLFIRGAEITRDTPPGHFNCLFLTDPNALDTEDFVEAIGRANQQGAFVFWNHQGWKGPELGAWKDVHTTLHQKGWFQGMEVCNGDEYYPEAHQWCLEKNFTMLGNSDIHAPDLRQRSSSQDHRTMTLVLVRQRTLDGIKEALQQRRTLVWYQDQLIGREDLLRPFFHQCMRLSKPHARARDSVQLEIRNCGAADVTLERTGKAGPLKIIVPAKGAVMAKLPVGDPKKPAKLEYAATNFLVAPEKPLSVTLEVPAP